MAITEAQRQRLDELRQLEVHRNGLLERHERAELRSLESAARQPLSGRTALARLEARRLTPGPLSGRTAQRLLLRSEADRLRTNRPQPARGSERCWHGQRRGQCRLCA